MGIRFFKRVKIGRWITLNLSKTGISTSVGLPGARMTFGNGKTRTTVGLPGTGISYTTVESDKRATGQTDNPSVVEYSAPIKRSFWQTVGYCIGVAWPIFIRISGYVVLAMIAVLGLFAAIIVEGSKKKGRRSPD